MTEQQGEQIIELLKQMNLKLNNMAVNVEEAKEEIARIYLRAIKIDTKI
jgi:hypothetical protein